MHAVITSLSYSLHCCISRYTLTKLYSEYVYIYEIREVRLDSGHTLKVLCDRSRMHTMIHYVIIKPDSRPDGTAIREQCWMRWR